MKKLIALAFCFALAVSVLTACGGNKDQKTSDATTKPTTVATEPSTKSTTPTSEATHPSTIPDSGFMPNQDGANDHSGANGGNSGTGSANGGNGGTGSANGGTGNGMDGAMDRGTGQSRTHAPSIVGGSR